MKVELTEKDERIVSSKIKSGRYKRPEDVVSAALDIFELSPRSRDELTQMVDEGIASGPSTPLTPDDLDGALERGIARAQRRRA